MEHKTGRLPRGRGKKRARSKPQNPSSSAQADAATTVATSEHKVESEEEKAFWETFGDLVGVVLKQADKRRASVDTVALLMELLEEWIPGATNAKWKELKGEMDRRFFENGKVVAAIYHAGHRFLKGNEMEAKRIAGAEEEEAEGNEYDATEAERS